MVCTRRSQIDTVVEVSSDEARPKRRPMNSRKRSTEIPKKLQKVQPRRSTRTRRNAVPQVTAVAAKIPLKKKATNQATQAKNSSNRTNSNVRPKPTEPKQPTTQRQPISKHVSPAQVAGNSSSGYSENDVLEFVETIATSGKQAMDHLASIDKSASAFILLLENIETKLDFLCAARQAIAEVSTETNPERDCLVQPAPTEGNGSSVVNSSATINLQVEFADKFRSTEYLKRKRFDLELDGSIPSLVSVSRGERAQHGDDSSTPSQRESEALANDLDDNMQDGEASGETENSVAENIMADEAADVTEEKAYNDNGMTAVIMNENDSDVSLVVNEDNSDPSLVMNEDNSELSLDMHEAVPALVMNEDNAEHRSKNSMENGDQAEEKGGDQAEEKGTDEPSHTVVLDNKDVFNESTAENSRLMAEEEISESTGEENLSVADHEEPVAESSGTISADGEESVCKTDDDAIPAAVKSC